MTADQREIIEKSIEDQGKKGQWVAVDTQSKVTGTDELGLPVFQTVFENEPQNYKLVRLIEPYNGAILEDLDYKEPTDEQKTEEPISS